MNRPAPLDRSLSYRLHRLHKLTDKASAELYAAEAGLALGEARCLAAIGAFGPLSVVDLGQHANLDKGQASRAAQSLVERGWVAKQASPSDGRGVVLTLNARGQVLYRKLTALIERRNREIAAPLKPAERRRFGELLDRMIAAASRGD